MFASGTRRLVPKSILIDGSLTCDSFNVIFKPAIARELEP
jgi:hypothetical protein